MGSLVLMGGDEFRHPGEPMDRALLEATGAVRPRLVVIPTAASTEDPERAARYGIHYFETLGAAASPGLILTRADAEDPRWFQELRGADVLYLTGGSPSYLLDTLSGTAAWEAIAERFRSGAMIVGSSAGAMVLAEKMRAPGSGVVQALGLVPGVVVVPHGESLTASHLSSLSRDLDERIVILIIDTATCCLSFGDGNWRVLGKGRVRVYAGGKASSYRSGDAFPLQAKAT